MAYLLQHRAGRIALRRLRAGWCVDFKGRRAGTWDTATEAVQALAESRSGLPGWDGLCDAAAVSRTAAPWLWVADSFEHPAADTERLPRAAAETRR
ncbi:hypothetical protein M0638_09800 [Roseomonas sp. NAR14]|uniref:Uncharacterized protein n=1 Tax=Roseomonas acroporae TaxID=2937791 RepID=A0A9X1Y7R9_9PROT|nr:hypothetical protein [Roseomonas acroporae]MCK8784675.1 hypothetical protein [Roseomonas acroporae]